MQYCQKRQPQKAPRCMGTPLENYSHLKHLIEIPKQIRVTALMIITGSNAFSSGIPRNAAFISCIPCVNGKTLIIFCIIIGITSKGSVAPENISMGKYRIQAITLALFMFFAIPPTNNPILKVDTIVKSQLPKNKRKEPCIFIFQKFWAVISEPVRRRCWLP